MENCPDRFDFQIGSAFQFFLTQFQYAFSRIATDTFQLVDNPSFDFITEFIQIDIFFLFLIQFPINVNVISCQLAG